LGALGDSVTRYTIVDISSSLRSRQQQTLAAFGEKVQWASSLPPTMQGVVVGNEVLDAMPVKLLVRKQGVWHERGVALGTASPVHFVWRDEPTDLRPPLRTLAAHLTRGAAFLIDYGFPEREYYHPQRHMGTVMCHQAHQSDPDPLTDVGRKDITAHVDFSGVALAAQDAGLNVLGYCTQARFLMNCGLLPLMEQASLPERANAHKLLMEHEMGELFKVIALGAGEPWIPLGFAQGDRTHTL
jgi:SAM-dependent MidA family methyltransferase